jgi:hypothetical protein
VNDENRKIKYKYIIYIPELSKKCWKHSDKTQESLQNVQRECKRQRVRENLKN